MGAEKKDFTGVFHTRNCWVNTLIRMSVCGRKNDDCDKNIKNWWEKKTKKKLIATFLFFSHLTKFEVKTSKYHKKTIATP